MTYDPSFKTWIRPSVFVLLKWYEERAAWCFCICYKNSMGRKRRISSAVVSLAVMGALAAAAQDRKPDLSGVWLPGKNLGFPGQPSFQPWAQALYQTRKAKPKKDDPAERCLPTGVPRIPPTPFKIVQTPAIVVILFEGNIHSFRQIFVDRRDHSKDTPPTWFGESVRKWDGNTLVVDTVGFNDRTWLDSDGKPHSDALHVIERFHDGPTQATWRFNTQSRTRRR